MIASMLLRFVRDREGAIHVARRRRRRGRERERTRFRLADIAELFVLVLLALRTIDSFVQIMIQSHAATAWPRAGASKILTQRSIHDQEILRRRADDDGVTLSLVSFVAFALLRVVQQTEGMTHVND